MIDRHEMEEMEEMEHAGLTTIVEPTNGDRDSADEHDEGFTATGSVGLDQEER